MMNAAGTPWRWSVNPYRYLQGGIGHQVEIVNGLDGEFSEYPSAPIGNPGGIGGYGFTGGLVTACLLYIGYRVAKKKNII